MNLHLPLTSSECLFSELEAYDIYKPFESRIALLQKAWRLFRCCCANMSEQPCQEHMNHLGGIRDSSDIEGKIFVLLVLHCEN